MPAGYIYSWNRTGSADFGTAANWYNATSGAPAALAPGVDDEALVHATGTLTGAGHVYDLGLTGTGWGLLLSGQFNADNAFIAGVVAITSGSSLTSDTIIDIGDDSANSIADHSPALLEVQAGGLLRGTLNQTDAFNILVGQYGGTGTLDVRGAGALADAGTCGFWVGNQGTGTISVGPGGQITAGIGQSSTQQIGLALGLAGGTGTLSVAGGGATFGDLAEIGFGGTGVLQLQQGATLVAGDGANSLSIGDAYGGQNGTGSVSIDASSATLQGVLEIGAFGQGSLTLADGATVSAGSTMTTGTASYWTALLGAASGSSGTLSLGGLSRFTAAHGIAVGSDGHGELDVVFSVLGIAAPPGAGSVALDVALDSGSSGLVSIVGGIVQDSGDAGVIVGGAGLGVLTIGYGGSLQCGGSGGFGGLAIGAQAGSLGSVSVAGAHSLIACAGQMDVGNDGLGLLSVSAGGSLSAGLGANAAGLVLGGGSGSGSFTVQGGAQVSVTGQAEIGANGSGSLSVISGGTFSASAGALAALEVAANASSTGTLLVSDAGSAVHLLGGLEIGGAGRATFTLQNGAVLSTSSLSANLIPGFVVAASSGTSTALVSGAGTALNDSGQCLVGGQGSGSGSLTVSSGAIFNVAQSSGQTVPAAVIAAGSGSGTSTVLVSGMDAATGRHSTWSIGGALLVGHLGHGALTVAAGGLVTAGSLTESDLAGGHGSVVVSGAGSTLAAGTLTIGSASSTGSLLVQSGGVVSVSGAVHVDGTVSLGGGTLTAGGALTVDRGSGITGQGVLGAASIIDMGRIGLNAGTLSCIGAITGTGQVAIGGGGHLLLQGSASTAIAFAAGGGTLTANAASALTGTIFGWSAGDAIDLATIAADHASFAGHTLSLFDGANHLLGTLTFAGALATQNFAIGHDASGGTNISFHS